MFKAFSFLLDLLFPVYCPGCAKEGEYLCEKCLSGLKFNEKKYFLNTPNLDRLFIAGDYDDKLLAELIKKYKFNYQEKIGPSLARFLCSFWIKILSEQKISEKELAKEFLVVPIPLSKRRERSRGFNQSAVLAKIFCATFSYEPSSALKRIKNRPPQSSLDEKARAKNIKDVFALSEINPASVNNRKSPQTLKNKTIILIDDVVTTGATLNEAAKILKAAGASQIYGLVLAKG